MPKCVAEATLPESDAQEHPVILPSGLRYRILKPGSGRKPRSTDTVECNFRGILLSTTFDDSYRPGLPVTIRIPEVIPGLGEALQHMPVGSLWQLFIPPELAYGARGYGAKIRSFSTIQIELELLAIQ